jgi:subtilisin family serine protease
MMTVKVRNLARCFSSSLTLVIGHGTHVSGIIAAQTNPYGFLGAAPDVTLGAYRVFGCSGSAGNDVLIAAYNQAYEDGADIITASIGGETLTPSSPCCC